MPKILFGGGLMGKSVTPTIEGGLLVAITVILGLVAVYIPLIGYTTWGCIDCVSAGTGQYAKRYGFIYVNRHDDGTGDFARSRKDSFFWYKKVIASDGEDLT